MMTQPSVFSTVAITLLAGGRGSRMHGQDKGWVNWQQRPLIEHIHSVVRPLTTELIISCNRNHQRYQALADILISDPQDDFPGPLIGIIGALQRSSLAQIMILPCDAPLIDTELLTQLAQAAATTPVMYHHKGFAQPLFSLIPRTLLAPLERLWAQGMRSPKQALAALDARYLTLADDDPRLANFNEPSLLMAE